LAAAELYLSLGLGRFTNLSEWQSEFAILGATLSFPAVVILALSAVAWEVGSPFFLPSVIHWSVIALIALSRILIRPFSKVNDAVREVLHENYHGLLLIVFEMFCRGANADLDKGELLELT
jgi:hypothetical protein